MEDPVVETRDHPVVETRDHPERPVVETEPVIAKVGILYQVPGIQGILKTLYH